VIYVAYLSNSIYKHIYAHMHKCYVHSIAKHSIAVAKHVYSSVSSLIFFIASNFLMLPTPLFTCRDFVPTKAKAREQLLLSNSAYKPCIDETSYTNGRFTCRCFAPTKALRAREPALSIKKMLALARFARSGSPRNQETPEVNNTKGNDLAAKGTTFYGNATTKQQMRQKLKYFLKFLLTFFKFELTGVKHGLY